MEDNQIVALYIARSEEAIAQTKGKYGKRLFGFAKRIVNSDCDAEECENDTYLGAWNSIPPASPPFLFPFLCSICRNCAVSRVRRMAAQKRGRCEYQAVYEELEDFLSDETSGDPADRIALRDALDAFLSSLEQKDRKLFMRRYYYLCSVREIASEMKMSEGSVKTALYRLRERLRRRLTDEGFEI